MYGEIQWEEMNKEANIDSCSCDYDQEFDGPDAIFIRTNATPCLEHQKDEE